MATVSQLTNAKFFLQQLRADAAGNTLAMIAAAMVPLAGMIGGGLDMSRVYMARAKLQNACDAASLAGRQGMTGSSFTSEDLATANRFFNFNFPAGTMDAANVAFTVQADPMDAAALDATASADIPTSLMKIFGKEYVSIAVNCDAKRDLGNNDVMLVLDVTGSMNCPPGTTGGCGGVEQPGSKVSRLRSGAMGLYRALDDGSGARTRYGIMPYSGTVNVGRRLKNNQVLRTTNYPDCSGYGSVPSSNGSSYWGCDSASMTGIHINNTIWHGQGSGTNQRLAAWRKSGDACIEERPTIGNDSNPIRTETAVTQDDIDLISRGWWDAWRKWGRYDPNPLDRNGNPILSDIPHTQVACPAEATKLKQFGGEAGFQTAINDATARVTGGTFHDLGMIWGMRFISPTGLFAATNPTEFSGYPVNKHIIFMTDGLTDTWTNPWYYSAYGVTAVEDRMQGPGDDDANHVARYHSACALARTMNITVWVIALDVTDTSDIEPCASSADHFYTSDGTDLEEVFTQIGQGIGDLRLVE